jgi:hypothetical protein
MSVSPPATGGIPSSIEIRLTGVDATVRLRGDLADVLVPELLSSIELVIRTAADVLLDFTDLEAVEEDQLAELARALRRAPSFAPIRIGGLSAAGVHLMGLASGRLFLEAPAAAASDRPVPDHDADESSLTIVYRPEQVQLQLCDPLSVLSVNQLEGVLQRLDDQVPTTIDLRALHQSPERPSAYTALRCVLLDVLERRGNHPPRIETGGLVGLVAAARGPAGETPTAG